MKNPIPQMEPWFGPEEKTALMEYMDEGGWLTEHKRTQKFEQMIADYTGAKHCVVVNNGTISLTLATLALDIGPGDEVIVPNYTMIATPNSVKILGAKPVFVDVEAATLCMDPLLARAAITPKTKAIMLVSANGRYPAGGIAAFESLARETGVTLIEDSAQSLGSHFPDGRHIGRAGAIGSFSFSAPKIISTGQGGALITDNDDLAFKLRRLKDFGRSGGGNDLHDSVGFNFKFTELQACIGIEQMKKLAWRVARKKEICALYRRELQPVASIRMLDQDLQATTPWFIDVLTEKREELKTALASQGIGSRVMYPPINRQKAYNEPGSFPVSEDVGNRGLWLPSASQLSDSDVLRVTGAIKAFFHG